MKTSQEPRVSTKLFVGCKLTAELRMKLNTSAAWKLAQIEKSKEGLILTHFQSKEYVGQYSPYQMLTVQQVKNECETIDQALKAYCQEIDPDTLKHHIFPQIFVM